MGLSDSCFDGPFRIDNSGSIEQLAFLKVLGIPIGSSLENADKLDAAGSEVARPLNYLRFVKSLLSECPVKPWNMKLDWGEDVRLSAPT